jgi:Cys-tRNA synthase (O-phospho-L-seryl-tRNA:Cys-tRNA synthase)
MNSEVSDSRKASAIKILRPWLKYLRYFDHLTPILEGFANEKRMLAFFNRLKKKEIKSCRDSLTKLLKVSPFTTQYFDIIYFNDIYEIIGSFVCL